MKKFIVYIISLLFLSTGIALILPVNPYSFYSEFIAFVKGFIPLFLIFSGFILLLFNLIDIKDKPDNKPKQEIVHKTTQEKQDNL